MTTALKKERNGKPMKVCKFGGTSLASANQIKKVCDIITSDPHRKIAVVSAPGKRHADDTKVTDLLIATADAHLKTGNASAEMAHVITRYAEICDDLGLNASVKKHIQTNLENLLTLSVTNKTKFIDTIKAAGEDNAAKITAEYLCLCGHKASYVNPKDAGLLLSSAFGNARVLPISYANLQTYFANRDEISVFPGFFGFSPDGSIVTFSRGGSDITGAILAAATNASVYENFTDVDSVFAANPNIIENPVPIQEITYREMRELAYAGFSVLHEETLAPVYKAGINVNIRNTNNPNLPGTLITPTRKQTHLPVAGIAGDKGFLSFYVNKYLMNQEVGFGRKLLQIFEEEGVPFEHMPSGIDDVSVIVRESVLTDTQAQRIVDKIQTELEVDDVHISNDIAILILVGEGMQYQVGIAAKATSSLAEAGINIEMLNQGSSEISIMIGVKASDCDRALKALYHAFF